MRIEELLSILVRRNHHRASSYDFQQSRRETGVEAGDSPRLPDVGYRGHRSSHPLRSAVAVSVAAVKELLAELYLLVRFDHVERACDERRYAAREASANERLQHAGLRDLQTPFVCFVASPVDAGERSVTHNRGEEAFEESTHSLLIDHVLERDPDLPVADLLRLDLGSDELQRIHNGHSKTPSRTSSHERNYCGHRVIVGVGDVLNIHVPVFQMNPDLFVGDEVKHCCG